MCIKVVINKGEKEIESPRQFREHFGFMPEGIYIDEDDSMMDECLCWCDFDETFKIHNIPFKYDPTYGEYYVGMLDEIEIKD